MTQEKQESLEIIEDKPEVAAEIGVAAISIAVTMLFLFAWIATQVARSQTLHFDNAIRNYVHQFASPGFTVLMRVFSTIGGQVLTVLAIVTPILLWLSGKRRASLWLMTTMVGALVLDLALKYGFHRQRPTPYFGGVPLTYSFPSGHSLFSFCFFGTLAGLLATRASSKVSKVMIYFSAALLIFLIGLSRIYLGVHYPTDVIAGYLAAAIWVSAIVMLDRLRLRRKANG